MKLEDALVAFVDSMVGVLSPRTVAWYEERLCVLVDQLGACDVETVRVADLRAWRRGIVEEKDLSPYTVAGYVRACRRFFSWLERECIVATSPAGRLEMPRLPRREPKAIDPEDLVKMLRSAKESGARDYALLRFVADTGCRLGGVVGLRVSDVDLDALHAVVCEKGGQLRLVFFGEVTAGALRDYLAERGDWGSDRLWVGRKGPLTKDGVRHIFRNVAEKAGVTKNWGPHAFRHGWARGALRNGADLGTVSQVLGHSSIAVTHEFYGIWADEELGERARAFSPLNDVGL